ncbi:MAG: 50S ribosomal protein L13, partial [Thermus sp.]
MRTYFPKPEEMKEPRWVLIDAEGKTLGRLATQIATL